jgi:hypothetical protein
MFAHRVEVTAEDGHVGRSVKGAVDVVREPVLDGESYGFAHVVTGMIGVPEEPARQRQKLAAAHRRILPIDER